MLGFFFQRKRTPFGVSQGEYDSLYKRLEQVLGECQVLRTQNDDMLHSNALLSIERDYLKSELEKLAHVQAVYRVTPPLMVSNHTRQPIIIQL